MVSVVTGIKNGKPKEFSVDSLQLPYPQTSDSMLDYHSLGYHCGMYFNSGEGKDREAIAKIEIDGKIVYENEDILNEYEQLISPKAKAEEEALENARYREEISNYRNGFENAITKMSEKEKEIFKDVIELTQDANDALDNNDIKKSMSLYIKAEGIYEKITLQEDMASKNIKTLEKRIGKNKELIIVDEDIIKMLEVAKKLYNDGDYVSALNTSIMGNNKIHELKEELN